MTDLHINIVSLNIPLPANYGGVIDIYYKVRALHRMGVKIHLHCFTYGRNEQKELLNYCEEIFYYKRNTGILSNVSLLPYIVYSRRNKTLLKNLQNNSYPVLFEGLHTTYYLVKNKLRNRKVIVRFHNIEHDYYRYLARKEKNIINRLYFYKESYLLKQLISKIPGKTWIAAISPSDASYLESKFSNVFWLPPFHPNNELEILTGKGQYALYHGNLSVPENEESAVFLIKQFAGKDIHLKIAGQKPSKKLNEMTQRVQNISLLPNPGEQEMNSLVLNAQVILLPAFQPTGIKLKLIESLYKGRHCIVNHAMVKNTHLENLCMLTENDFYTKTLECMSMEFTETDISIRKKILETHYNNRINAEILVEWLQKNDSHEPHVLFK